MGRKSAISMLPADGAVIGSRKDSHEDLLRLAQHAQNTGDLPRAEKLYRIILAGNPNRADILSSLAAICNRTGRNEEALALFFRALAQRPNAPDILANLGVVLLACGRASEALVRCDQALALLPNHPMLHDNRGNVLIALGQDGEALCAYERALQLAPDFAEAHDNRGVVLARMKRYQEALVAHERALELRPNTAKTWYNRAAVLLSLKRPGEALLSIDRALALAPDFPEAWSNRGVALIKLRRSAEAIVALDRALFLRPGYREALRNRGMALVELSRPEEALDICGHCSGVDDVPMFQVRAAALIALNRPEEAIGELDQVIANDDPAAIWTLRAHALQRMGKFDEARAAYIEAMRDDPDNPLYQWNLSIAELMRGNFASGWRFYESRWRLDDSPPPVAGVLWTGDSDLSGKKLLIHCEQGYGDTLQFCRYASLAAEQGAMVELRVQTALKDLLKSVPGVHGVSDITEPLPEFDVHCPMLSMPLAMGTDTESIPAIVPYLRAAPESVEQWRAWLGDGSGIKIGLVVSGNPEHKNDENRSLPLGQIKPLLQLDAQFFLLQQVVQERDRSVLADCPEIRFMGDRLRSFADTAGLISHLDLVISVDTSVAHLAGAMGKPVWILLPLTPDWRWLLNRDDSPWYPSATLFRQTRFGDWAGVIARVLAAIGQRYRVSLNSA